jgi:hypothetical protein
MSKKEVIACYKFVTTQLDIDTKKLNDDIAAILALWEINIDLEINIDDKYKPDFFNDADKLLYMCFGYILGLHCSKLEGALNEVFPEIAKAMMVVVAAYIRNILEKEKNGILLKKVRKNHVYPPKVFELMLNRWAEAKCRAFS